jgi:RNA polymerase sigma-70 factor (ECF subfamily)
VDWASCDAASKSRLLDFEPSVTAELPVLYRVARRLTLNPQEAEDLVGEVLLLAAKAWSRFDGQHVRSWLLQILRNAYLNSLRHSRPTTRPLSGLEASYGEPPDPTDTFETVANRLAAEKVMSSVDKLPIEYRMAITLCDLEDISQEEAAVILGIPLGTVRSRLHRGRKLLRPLLQGYSNTPVPPLTQSQAPLQPLPLKP